MVDKYDYKNNIKVTSTPHGDVVITMNKAAHTVLLISLYEAIRTQEQEGRKATAEDTARLSEAIEIEEGE